MAALLFSLLTLLFLLFFYLGTARNRTVLIVSVIWISVVSGLASAGFFQNTNTIPPRFLIVFVGNIILVVYLFKILKNHPIDHRFSMGIHSFRFPVEVALYFMFLEGLVPKIMTFDGWNFDIFTGVTAILWLIAIYIFKINPGKKILLIWNFLGLMLVTIIVTIGILSAPLPIQQLAFDQPNVAVLRFPYILLPAYIVPVVVLTHILTIKKLLAK